MGTENRVRNLAAPENPVKIVRSRKPYELNMPIVVSDGKGIVWYEKQHKINGWDEVGLVNYLRDNWPRKDVKHRNTVPVMWVCHNPRKLLHTLHQNFKNDPQWRVRITRQDSENFHLDGKVRKAKVQVDAEIRVSYFGFQAGDRHSRYFHPISPRDFFMKFREYGDPDWPEYLRMYRWAGELRDLMKKNHMRFTASKGGLASQLLRDPKFYPDARRKVPGKTNEKSRPYLPGNFYAMRERSLGGLYPFVYIIDQENAHHYAASSVRLPAADTLFARGRFLTENDKPYVQSKTQEYDYLRAQHGLFRVFAAVPAKNAGTFGPPWAAPDGGANHGGTTLKHITLFSNEFEFAESLGIEIRGISHAFCSPDLDQGISKYADWCVEQIKLYPEKKPWLKPILLSTYGILGSKPRKLESAYHGTSKGELETYSLGPIDIDLKKVVTKKQFQSPIANVIHRAMIEAETRRLSIELAHKLEREGHHVIGIHADAILVLDEGQKLPLLPQPWRVKDRLTRLKVIDDVSFESDTMVILPGRKRNAKSKG